MNHVYDNGCIMLGTKRDIVDYVSRLMPKLDYHDDMEAILNDIKDEDDDTILAINYDNGMGYSIDYWDKNDIV